MRHKMVHDYMAIDEDIVWQVVTNDLCNSRSVDRVLACEALSRHSRRQLAGIHLAFLSPSLTKFGIGKDGSPITNVGDD